MSERRLDLVWSKREASARDPFEALIAEAEHDAAAATGFALAYAELALVEREALLTTLLDGSAEEGPLDGAIAALALLLSVESDAALAERIAAALREYAPEATAPGADRGHTWGDDEVGGVAVARALHGEFLTTLRVSWDAAPGAFEVDFTPLATSTRALAVPPGASSVGAEVALDRLAESLWRRRRRHGPLPERLRSIAGLLGPETKHRAAR